MEIVKGYKCSKCGEIFDDLRSCKSHEKHCSIESLKKRISDLESKIKSLESEIVIINLKLKDNSPNYTPFPPITVPSNPSPPYFPPCPMPIWCKSNEDQSIQLNAK